MKVVRTGKNLLLLLQNHWRVAAFAFIAGAGAWLTLGMLWPKQYTGSALVALNLSAIEHQSASALNPSDRSLPATMAAQLRQTVARMDWAGIIARYHPYSEIEADGGPAHAAANLASRVSITPASDMRADVARITYAGSDRDLVLGVTTEVADGFAKPIPQVAHATAPEEPLYAPVILPDFPPPAAKPALKGTRNRARREAHSARRHWKAASPTPVQTPAPDAAELSAALQASLADGAKLQNALKENASNLDQLKQRLNEQQNQIRPASQPSAGASTPQPERRPTPQEERLSQDLAKAQRELAILRDRYTDEYPDVVRATERVRDLLLDMSRISALAPAAAKAPPQKQPQTDTRRAAAANLAALVSQINEAEAVQTRLQLAFDRNQNETAMLHVKLAAAGPVGASTTAGSNQAAPPSDALLASASDANSTTANPDPGSPSASSATNSAAVNPGQSSNAATPPATSDGVSPFFLVQQPEVTTHPLIFATSFLWPLSLAFGILAALLAAWLVERRDPFIRNEIMLRHELPASAVYLGGIPRIRHEVIAD